MYAVAVLPRIRCLSPTIQDFLHVSGHMRAGRFPILAEYEQLIVACVSVPHVGSNRKVDSRRIEPLGRR